MSGRKVKNTGGRVVLWFSCGAASAVAAKLALKKYAGTNEVVIAYIDVGSEHPDNERFLSECSEWFGHPITRLKSDKYADTWDVWEKTRFLVGPKGAGCTTKLKKAVRQKFELFDDIQVFGYTAEEVDRAAQFRRQNDEVMLDTPLITAGLGKADCLAMIERAGIELPMMYRLGYHNNNCIGCVKGGPGYWNKIRVDFPDTFERMAKLERSIGATICKLGSAGRERVYLDELHPDAGADQVEPDISCSLLCHMVWGDVK
jgi:3'-phosphoadenosine 5'-phosphosulfate sulfotransferase (PAPS reductase)/FAD synthetase